MSVVCRGIGSFCVVSLTRHRNYQSRDTPHSSLSLSLGTAYVSRVTRTAKENRRAAERSAPSVSCGETGIPTVLYGRLERGRCSPKPPFGGRSFSLSRPPVETAPRNRQTWWGRLVDVVGVLELATNAEVDARPILASIREDRLASTLTPGIADRRPASTALAALCHEAEPWDGSGLGWLPTRPPIASVASSPTGSGRSGRGPRSESSRSAPLLAASTSPPGRPPRPSVVEADLSPGGREERPHAALSASSRVAPRGGPEATEDRLL